MVYGTLGYSKNFDKNRSLICKFGYVDEAEYETIASKSRMIAETLEKWAVGLDPEIGGRYIMLLTPSVTFDSDEYISIRYDFTVTCGGAILFHRRFAQNYRKRTATVILGKYVAGLKYKGDYYLTLEDRLYAVPIVGSLTRGTRIRRREEISSYCDGPKRAVKILIPSYL